MTVRQQLVASDFFSHMSERNLDRLGGICLPKKIARRDTLFLEGQEGSLFFLLVDGRIQLYRLNPDGREVSIKVVGPGDVFAEVILFEEDHYPVCAAALTDCDLLAIPSIQFVCLLEDQEFRNDFITLLMKKQRYLTRRIMYLTSNDVESRFLGFLDEQYGREGSYTIQISKKDIATAIGATPETLSRLIQRLTAAGLISWQGKRLTVDESCWDGLP
jgi:CRP/FNR family transcriptional regulator, dissimilatory nitrate respiration regulator